MANRVIFNQREGKALIKCDANNTIAPSDLALDGDETVTGLIITQVAFSGSNTWTIARGANTLLELSGTDHWNLAAAGIALSTDSAANVEITNAAADAGTLLIEVKKIGSMIYN